MSNKSFCDKCGEEIPVLKTDDWGATTPNTVISVKRDKDCRKKQKNYDICDKCLAAFETWMAEKKQPYIEYAGVKVHIEPNTLEFPDGDGYTIKVGEEYPIGDPRRNRDDQDPYQVYCTTITGRLSSKDPNLSNIQQRPKFTIP